MALQYNVVRKIHPLTKAFKWYASTKHSGKRELDDLSKDIAEVSSFSAGDIHRVIKKLIELLPKWLMEGDSVKLDGFGSFRLSFSSKGVTSKEEVTANLITDIHIIFEPDEAIKERISKTLVIPSN